MRPNKLITISFTIKAAIDTCSDELLGLTEAEFMPSFEKYLHKMINEGFPEDGVIDYILDYTLSTTYAEKGALPES